MNDAQPTNPHPAAISLEAFAAGEPNDAVETHVASCTACDAFVTRLRSDGAAFASDLDFDRLFVDAQAHVASQDRALNVTRAWAVGVPLAMAAAVLVFVRLPASPQAPAASSPEAPVAVVDEPNGGGTTFKGGPQLAVIRLRGADQDRIPSSLKVRPGDKLRLEIALERPQAILGGIVTEGGEFVEMMPLATRPSGTHFSEKAVAVDATPTRGWLVAGSVAEIERARMLRRPEGIPALRLEWEPAP
jgi:hypothetical protein